MSLVQYAPSPGGPAFTTGGRKAARYFHRALDQRDREAARAARAIYSELIPKEKLGEEYSAFAWCCDYLLATPEERRHLPRRRFVADFVEFLGGDKFTHLKNYVWEKYSLDVPDSDLEQGANSNELRVRPEVATRKEGGLLKVDKEKLKVYGEYLFFNNPRREDWEKTSEILEVPAA